LTALRRKALTHRDALTECGIARLAARVHDLRHMGYDIHSELVRVNTRAGQARVARYVLLREPKQPR
jgi:hypothetical protein